MKIHRHATPSSAKTLVQEPFWLHSVVRHPIALLTAGGVVTSLFSAGPILEGIGLNITAWTYAAVMHISILGCSATLPDPWMLARDLEDESAAWAIGG